MAISGDTVIVGARRDDDYSGSAYVFRKIDAEWIDEAKLIASAGDTFGESVAISGDTVIVGAPGDGPEYGAAYIYQSQVVAGAQSLSISPDGRDAYVARGSHHALSVFNRDSVSGKLTFVEEVVDSANLPNPYAIEISPDGTLAYVTTNAGVSVLSRDSATGKLTLGNPIDTTNIGRPVAIEVSGDSQFVYVAGDEDKIGIYSRTESDDHTLVGGDPVDVSKPTMLALSPDSKNLYVAREAANAISVFSRDPSTGLLTYVDEVRNGMDGVRGLLGVASLEVTDEYVFAVGSEDDSLIAFKRDDGASLTFAQRLRNRSGGVQGLENPNSIAVSPDGKSLYVGSNGEGAVPGGLSWFGVDPAPSDPAAPLKVGYSGMESLTVRSAGGDDLVSVRDVGIPLTVETGDGPDIVSLSFDSVEYDATVQTAAGEDTVAVSLGNVTTGMNGKLTLDTGDDPDEVTVGRVGDNAQLTILAGAGDDVIQVAGTRLSLYSTFTLNGEEDEDWLRFDSGPYPIYPRAPNTLDGTIEVDGEDYGMVTYSGIEHVPGFEGATVEIVGEPYAIKEGEDLTLSASATPATNTRITAFLWDLNRDGIFGEVSDTVSAIVNQPAQSTVTVPWEDLFSLGLGDGDTDGMTYTISLRALDDAGNFAETETTVTVTDGAPTVDINGAPQVTEGALYQLHLSSNDPGDDTISRWEICWDWADNGDNVFEQITGNPSVVSHRYDTVGVKQITARAYDEDGTYQAVVSQTAGNTVLSVTAADAVPELLVGGAESTYEGEDYVLSVAASDPAGDVIDYWIIEWADGSLKTTVQDASATLTHTFRDDSARADGGVFAIGVTAVGEDGVYSATQKIPVGNVAPELQIDGAGSVNEGEEYTLNLSASDPGEDTVSMWEICWDWVENGNNQFEIVAGGVESVVHRYADDGNFTITAIAIDEDGTYGTNSLSVTVGNVSPTVTLTGPEQVNEGSSFWLALGPLFDPGQDTVTQYIIDWGDNTSQSSIDAPSPNEFGFVSKLTLSHVYANGPNTRSISVHVVDEDGTHTGAGSFEVAVFNVVPSVFTGRNVVMANEGDTVVNTVTFSDPGADTVSLTASLGSVVDNGDGSWSWLFATRDGPNESQLVTITATDSDSASTDAMFDLVVNNVAPQFEAGPNETLLPPIVGFFNRRNITFTDPGEDIWSGTVNFGEGAGNQELAINSLNKTFDLSHTYMDEGTYGVSVTVQDDDGGSWSDSFWVVVVLNTPPVADAGGPYTLDEGAILTLDGSGSTDEEENIISWEWDLDNDGEYDDATGLTTTFSWADDGLFTVGLKVTDGYGEFNVDSATVTVNNIAPTLSGVAVTPTVEENGTAILTGTIIDPGTLDSFAVTVDWGDSSTPDVFSYAAGTTSFNETHQYLDDNPSGTPGDQYSVSVTVMDDDTGEDSTETTLTVSNVAPEITALVSSAPEVGDAKPGDLVTVSGLFADIGTLDTHTAVIDWGDGSVASAVIDQTAGSFSGTHVYTTGGIFDIRVILSDDDQGTAEGWSTALVTGARLKDGELQVVGTNSNDWVEINEVGKKLYKVHSNFLPGRCHFLTFNAAEVESIRILLGDGNDHASIAGNIDLPVTIDGGAGNDHLNAGRGPTILIGGEGNDKLIGGKGDDQIYGGGGNDLILGGGGHDLLDGGTGDDKIFGSCGDDVILGGEGNDRIYGNGGSDFLDGGAGNDKVMGGRGSDELSGGEGNDRLYGGSGSDVLNGGPGDDRLFGDRGNDQLLGGDGDDLLVGGPGRTLWMEAMGRTS